MNFENRVIFITKANCYEDYTVFNTLPIHSSIEKFDPLFNHKSKILISWGDNPERKITKIMAKYLLQGLSAEAQPAT